MPSRVAEILSNAAPLYPGDADELAKWARAAQMADGKLLPDADLGMDTTGVTINVAETVGTDADVTLGGFEDGWVASPALGECPRCDGEQAQVAIGNPDKDIVLIDCLNCRTRFDLDGFEREVAANA